MHCPSCGAQTADDGMICAYCGKPLRVIDRKPQGVFPKCVECGARLPFLSAKRAVCDSCYQRDMAREKERERFRKSNDVSVIIARHPELRDMIMKRLGLKEFNGPMHVSDHDYQEFCGWAIQLQKAKNLGLAGRNEDSARVYESLGMWKEAGIARKEAGSTTIKHVSVNLNDLLDKLREGGLAIPYKCRICGAVMTIDKNSKAESLTRCAYCGTATNTDALLDIIQEALK